MMKAVLLKDFGSADQLYIGETEKPTPKEGELLVRVEATTLNRADIVQRKGRYAPPPGASDILGLETAGVIEAVGPNCGTWKVGDRIASLLTGGGYAQFCLLPYQLAIPIPDQLTFPQGASIPEVWMTAYQVLYFVADIETVKPEFVLIHAGASSVGIAATQLATALGSKVIVTCGSQEKADFCTQQVGAHAAIQYKQEAFEKRVEEITNGKGAGIIIDCVGGGYFQQNLASLSVEGRLVIIGWLSGTQVPDCNLALILRKRLRIEGSTLRARDLQYKEKLAAAIRDYCLPKILDGSFKIFIDREFPVGEIKEAHEYMEANKNKGKIVISGFSSL
uniref:Enoyl reductase (ER) domain-containing protein n=1 Tax=Vannella robusta TaxID=1487602 RepID=A0A7S4HZX1_9EUKA|mmetsp:Transcript_18393/g.23301  ORF Transcript_18393/g.23301 Transcript_18393/m.23301 type:complete len:335 (+) Transcript_18393:3-1007(+)